MPKWNRQGNDFAQRLHALREERGLSQYELARRTGLTRQTLSRLEMGDRDPTWGTVQLLALALAVDCREFRDPSITLPEVALTVQPDGLPKSRTEANGQAEPKRSRKAPAAAQETPVVSEATSDLSG
jgi:transcriptional regulator with XRE-family HTH domain